MNRTYSKFGFFGKKVIISRKNLKIDNYSYCIKNILKSSNIVEKNIVWFAFSRENPDA